MAICRKDVAFDALGLPEEFEGLEGLVRADLQAVVSMLTQRAHERLFLTRREHRELQATLWNGLVAAINEAVDPLRVENR